MFDVVNDPICQYNRHTGWNMTPHIKQQ